MKFRKAISGGQTGVDQTAIKEAKTRGIETGGWSTKGWHTEKGAEHWLAGYGLKEHESASYPPRTIANVKDSNVTMWFGKMSPGYWCTRKACIAHKKEFVENPTREKFLEVVDTYEVINFAGNRMSKNPEASALCSQAFGWLDEDR